MAWKSSSSSRIPLIYWKLWMNFRSMMTLPPSTQSPKQHRSLFWNVVTFALMLLAVVSTCKTTVNIMTHLGGGVSRNNNVHNKNKDDNNSRTPGIESIQDKEKTERKLLRSSPSSSSSSPLPPRSEYKATLYHTISYNRSSDSNVSPTPSLWEIMGKPEYCGNCTTEAICRRPIHKKFLRKEFTFLQPGHQWWSPHEEDDRPVIPRIIHQSWYEEITSKTHPNLSRLQNSWKWTGWEYRFYSDDVAAAYIRDHFPPEIYEAYDALIPGAFKADFFRYCALFHEGGVWADIDMHLQTNLDAFVESDRGFIVPRDIHGYGLHNAFMISAPGHPILAKAIEEATNMIRNRYTIMDIAARYCPNNVNHKVLRDHSSLFLTGPGLLAYAMHVALQYPLSVPFSPGPIGRESLLHMMNITTSSDIGEQFLQLNRTLHSGIVPGKTVILERHTSDMGETRYTDIEKNWIIAGTDLPSGYDTNEKVHYGETMKQMRVWGIDGVYKDMESVDERIKIKLVVR